MLAEGVIERFLDGQVPIAAAPDEAAWHQAWHEGGLNALPPVLSALQGGMCADRLSWVFIAGYQAAIRHVFPEVPGQGWAAYAATEDKAEPEAYPPTRLSIGGKGLVLDGCKSWLAQSRHLDHLLVTINETEQCVLVSARDPGVHLSHREAPGFLGDMSQGFARFEAVEIAPKNIFAKERMREFGRREPRFVMLAGVGYLLAHLGEADPALQRDLIAIALSLAVICESPEIIPKTFAALDRALQEAIGRFADVADTAALPNWDSDRRLLSMYSPRIQERAAR
ncbi:MAG: hypothetical protein QF512_15875 [Alphaproteobacteria bacterium]|jgi:hypothetical protein|nr:hypothetical protein [Alphaproteobacteria bacterium]